MKALARRALLTGVALLAGSCAPDAGSAPGAGEAAQFQLTASIEEIMRYLVDPAADSIWNAVVTEVTAAGVREHAPETDEEWETLRGHAVTLVEATNLLLMEGRRVAAPGSRSEMPGVDLEPEQIEALLAADRAAWTAFVGGLHATGTTVLAAIDAKSVEGLLVAGDELDLACENCHVRYWYPSLAEPDSTP
jgi:hypothetical protein